MTMMMLLPTLDKSCLVSKLTLSTKSSHQPLHIVWKQTFEEYDVADAEKSENDDEGGRTKIQGWLFWFV